MHRRTLFVKTFAIASVAASGCLAGAAHAQAFPNKPITLIVPFTAGGSSDVHLRALADQASKILGQPIVIDNKPGAVGTLGPSLMATTAKPDGYTIGMVSLAVFRQPFIQKVSYDPLKDFTYIIGVSDNPFGLVVREDREWKTLEQFIGHAKRNPGKVNIGVPGRGSPGHLVSDQIATQFDLKWTVVPYRGTANTMQALLAGEIDAAAESTGWVPFVEGSKARLLAVFSRQRFRKFPGVPTLIEQKIDAWDYSPWGIVAPAGLDPAIATRLHDAIRRVMEQPEFVHLLATLAQEPLYMSPQQYVAYVREALPQQKAIVEKYNLRAS
jgi:tripartite-type tricarboxylate transporter receptor subunit TctC